MLGLSNASGMFDITGTMLMVYWAFAYGFKSLWIPWLWPVFNQIFLMVYLSVWLRRSNVLTGAEWIKTRFGKGKGATLSHTIVVVFALLSVLGFLSYGFIGIGKFMEIFIPWKSFHPTFLSRYHRSMFRMYTVSSSQLSPPSTSCWGNAEHRMDRCRTVPYHDGGRHRYRSDRYADGGAGYDTLLRTCRMGFPFLRMDARY